ncbi:hypothetical protein FPQ18DRAFT_311184 [Pyronema domesticum]|nr:hypothetical protein FPQ18DRAFT_311184 [Pyronema domesticum]
MLSTPTYDAAADVNKRTPVRRERPRTPHGLLVGIDPTLNTSGSYELESGWVNGASSHPQSHRIASTPQQAQAATEPELQDTLRHPQENRGYIRAPKHLQRPSASYTCEEEPTSATPASTKPTLGLLRRGTKRVKRIFKF